MMNNLRNALMDGLNYIEDIVLEDKDYNAEETKGMYNIIANHIFSQSKKYINSEANKYGDILQDLKEMM